MGRLIAFILGGVALLLYGSQLVLPEETLADWNGWLQDTLANWYRPVFRYGPGVFAGLALILVAIRGRD